MRRLVNNLTLRYVLVLAVLLGVMLPSWLAYQIEKHDVYKRLVSELQQDRDRYADLLSVTLSQSLWQLDAAFAAPLIDKIMSDPMVNSIQVMRLPEGGIFIERSKTAMEVDSTATREISFSGKRLGVVTIAVNRRAIDREIHDAQWRFLSRTGGIAAAAVLLIYLALHWRLSSPIDRLVAQSRALASGSLQEPLTWERDDELGKVGHSLEKTRQSLNTLVDDLRIANTGLHAENAQRKLAEANLVLHAEELEHRVEERTEALNIAVERAEAANRSKSVFLANMSHELRTPLNSVLGFSSLLQNEENLTPLQREKLGIINRSGTHLLSVINSVLDMSKIEAGGMLLQPSAVALVDRVAEVIDMLQPQAALKNARLDLDVAPGVPGHLLVDEGKFRQILLNLLSNAVKHTRVDGGVVLRLGTHPSGGTHRVVIEVEDNGAGISAEDQARIFEPFVQSGQQAEQSGTGLGLAISREYARMMGGDISVHSTLGRGSVFRLEFYARIAPVALVQPTTQPKRRVKHLAVGQPNWRVLVVDDDPFQKTLLSMLLRDVGFDVMEASNGVEGVAHFNQWHPHFIWMDRRMPGMDGIETMRQIHNMPGGHDVKIVTVSAAVFSQEQDEVLAAGMDGFVRKPYREEEIYQCMVEVLGVVFEYHEPEVVTSAPASPSLSGLGDQTPENRQALFDALCSLEPGAIDEAISPIASNNEALGQTLRSYARGLDYEAILTALAMG